MKIGETTVDGSTMWELNLTLPAQSSVLALNSKLPLQNYSFQLQHDDQDAGPHRWIIYNEGEPIPPSRPNEGSVRRRKHRKRMEQRAAFRSREAQKRKDQLAAARRKKAIKKIERKMAAVARERAWVERLAQLKQAEADAGKTPA